MDLYEGIDPVELAGYARAAAQQTEETNFWAGYLPNEGVGDVAYSIDIDVEQTQEVAEVRAFNAEVTMVDRSYAKRKIQGQLLPISRGDTWGEYAQVRMRANPEEEILRQVYRRIDNLVGACLARVNQMRAELMVTGILTINEGGVVADPQDWGRLASHTRVAPILWTNTGTAQALDDIQNAIAQYNDTTGFDPGAMVMSKNTRSLFRQNAQVLTATVTPSNRAPLADLVDMLDREELPPIITNDERYNGQRILPDNQIVFVPPQGTRIGNTLHAPSAYATEIGLPVAEAPGIVAVAWTERNPVSIKMLADCVAQPILAAPNATMSLQVKA